MLSESLGHCTSHRHRLTPQATAETLVKGGVETYLIDLPLATGHHRPSGHDDEDDIAVEWGRGHRSDPEAPRVHRHGVARDPGRVPLGPGQRERRRGHQRAVSQNGQTQRRGVSVCAALHWVRRKGRFSWGEANLGAQIPGAR
jgi:hypothetical protein